MRLIEINDNQFINLENVFHIQIRELMLVKDEFVIEFVSVNKSTVESKNFKSLVEAKNWLTSIVKREM
jgi:hypothetical protein